MTRFPIITLAAACLLAGCSAYSPLSRGGAPGNSPQLASDFATAFTHLLLIEADADAFACACYFEEDGYASPQQCMDRTSISDADRQNLFECTYDVVLNLPPAPHGVRDFASRYKRASASYQRCLNLDANNCSDAEFNRQSNCRALLVAELEAEPADDASVRWFQSFDKAASNAGCY
ncbi:hypothetical protein FRC98_11115 [Lujinxingia vulgaris]|uniref:Lipoprotein n=1 Tax=Lujinxingia vulgaris TaxID=2600176 RepID=A0A5C6XEM2_9DELT|nr:hypothetical protein [Lujinxingia vulgaris]TXD37273.1 hypothetical protein FRC98_11115 [Lujinxingia vulgaris]